MLSMAMQGLNTSNAVTAFERMEEKVIALEAEAESTLQARSPPLVIAHKQARRLKAAGHAADTPSV